jgi:lysyl-tRNA synthetase class 2
VAHRVAGRLAARRGQGRMAFLDLVDRSGQIQLQARADVLGPEAMERLLSLDLGDLIGVDGVAFRSRRGELTLGVREFAVLAKSLRPPPEKHHGLKDVETRFRHRELDLMANPEARELFILRARVISAVRRFLDEQGFIEVETPVLQPLYGGAAARPFVTHLNAFGLDVSLRIATELYLKRAIVGGIDRVYELGRTFRNEGVDSTHSPEFSLLEAYGAFEDYDSMAELTRAIVLDAADTVHTMAPTTADGAKIELTDKWREAAIHDLVSDAVGESITPDSKPEQLRAVAERCGVSVDPRALPGEIVLELYEKLVEHTLIQPTFVRDYPVEVRPLARPHRSDPRLAEAWDLVIGGVEVAVAYSELADPVEQRRRLIEQAAAAAGGDPEAMRLDEDFLRALEYGMPPTGGMGLGVDRLLMTLTGKGIRETILFPTVKPL